MKLTSSVCQIELAVIVRYTAVVIAAHHTCLSCRLPPELHAAQRAFLWLRGRNRLFFIQHSCRKLIPVTIHRTNGYRLVCQITHATQTDRLAIYHPHQILAILNCCGFVHILRVRINREPLSRLMFPTQRSPAQLHLRRRLQCRMTLPRHSRRQSFQGELRALHVCHQTFAPITVCVVEDASRSVKRAILPVGIHLQTHLIFR